MAIGEKLKEAREEQQMSLESLQATTKIQTRYLQAIEDENFDILPGTFYARAFIKEYATAVGLDPNELFDEYEEELPQTEENTTANYSQVHRSRKDSHRTQNTSIFSFIPTLIVALLVIGIAFSVWFFSQESSAGEESDTVKPQDDNEVTRQTSDEEDTAEKSDIVEEDEKKNTDEEKNNSESNDTETALTVDEKGTGNSPESTMTLEHASDNIQVEIEVNGNSWLGVENKEGNKFISEEVTAEQSPIKLDLGQADRIWFNVGNAPALNITVDGTELEYPVDPNEEVFQKLWINVEKSDE